MLTIHSSRLGTAFFVAAGELGMCSTAWLFVRELAAEGGDAAVLRLRDELGRTFPVIDTIARQWLEGQRTPRTSAEQVVAKCRGASHVLVSGIESGAMDALCAGLPSDVRIGLIQHSTLEIDWERLLSNYAGRVVGVELTKFQLWAGFKSVLVSFVYGSRDHVTHVDPASARVVGRDVLTQFRSVVGWEVLGSPMYVYPRWFVDVPREVFSEIV
ncbi:MAG: hypothetical protein ACAI25_14980 [Planctomycetota bacterium]